jgi:multicomponent Na+:H+ antiporter subunit B
MSRTVRLGIFCVAAAGLAALLFWALVGVPDFGTYHWPYGRVLNHVVVAERHMTNAVGATVFDYRGFDTLGEEFILFSAVLGVSLLLRKEEEQERVPSDAILFDPIRSYGAVLVTVIFALGLWVVAFGFITPGGGFQGGVVLAGGVLLLYAVVGYGDYHALTPHSAVEFFESGGVGAYAVLGFVGLAAEGAYLRNFLGIGDTGTLFAGGSVSFVNWATGIEVCTAMVLLFSEFLKIHMIPNSDWKPKTDK